MNHNLNQNDQRVIKTKKALHVALVALLKTRPLEKISISTLCREAKVNRGTFYLHYHDVGTLFDEHIHYLLKDLEESYYEPYQHVPELTLNRLEPSMIRIFHHVKKYQSFYEIVFDKKSSLSYYYSLFNKIKSLLHESISNYQLGDKNGDLLLSYQTNAIMGLLIEWSENGFESSPEYMNEQFFSLLKMRLD